MLPVSLQNAQHKDKPLEICKPQQSVHVETCDWTFFVRESSWEQRERVRMTWSRLKFTNCILHNHTLRPGACPFPKHPILLSTSFHACDKTLFSLLVISGEKKRELIKPLHILVKDLEEMLASRVASFAISPHRTVGLLSHFPTY